MDSDDDAETMGSFSAYYWHVDMLCDDDRNEAYERAIAAVLGRRGTGARCLDIGTGSGLLALLCCKHGAQEVTAIEVVGELQSVAERNFRQNAGPVQLVRGHSLSLAPPLPPPSEVVVGELLDTVLIGEGCLPSMRHASRHLTTPGFTAIPSRATVYGQLCSSSLLRAWHTGAAAPLVMPAACRRCDGAAAAETAHVWPLFSAGLVTRCSDVFELMEFDFENVPGEEGRGRDVEVATHPPAQLTDPRHTPPGDDSDRERGG